MAHSKHGPRVHGLMGHHAHNKHGGMFSPLMWLVILIVLVLIMQAH